MNVFFPIDVRNVFSTDVELITSRFEQHRITAVSSWCSAAEGCFLFLAWISLLSCIPGILLITLLMSWQLVMWLFSNSRWWGGRRGSHREMRKQQRCRLRNTFSLCPLLKLIKITVKIKFLKWLKLLPKPANNYPFSHSLDLSQLVQDEHWLSAQFVSFFFFLSNEILVAKRSDLLLKI